MRKFRDVEIVGYKLIMAWIIYFLKIKLFVESEMAASIDAICNADKWLNIFMAVKFRRYKKTEKKNKQMK